MKKLSLSPFSSGASNALSAHLIGLLRRHPVPVIVCIGSDRVTGDCLGPLVGHFLIRRNVPAFVYGSLQNTVTAKNLVETLSFIKVRHRHSKILVVDASVGNTENVGVVTVTKGGILPGSGCGKALPEAGDFSITATVTENTGNAHALLQNTKLSFVYALSELISDGIARALAVLNSLNRLSG